MSDPIRLWRRRALLVAGGGCCALAVLSGWAMRAGKVETFTVRPASSDASLPSRDASAPAQDVLAVNADVFDVRLWNPIPQPEPVRIVEVDQDEHPQKTTPLRVELIAITTEHDARLAAVYDSTVDELLILRAGDVIQEHTIKEVLPRSVILVRGDEFTTLELLEPGADVRRRAR